MSPIQLLADRVFAYRLDIDWYMRTRMGLPVERLRVEGEDSSRADAAFAATVLADLRGTVANQPLSEDDLLTAGFLEHLLVGWVERDRSPLLGFTVTPYSSYGIALALQTVFPGFSGPASKYVSLVADQRDQVIELRERLVRQREAGILIPAPALPGVRESLRRLRGASAAALPASAPSEVRDRAAALVETEVLPAYDALLSLLDEEYKQAAPTQLGLGQYDGGEAFYRALVREQTASDRSPEELHQLGLDQVAELTEKMAMARADMGIAGTEQEFHAELATDPRVHASAPEEVEALFLKHMARLEPLLSSWFSVLPRAPYGVERLAPESEVGMTYGYYEAPTMSQPVGRYRWNGSALETKSLLTYATLIFHELAPGHHFHIARQAENAELPDLRRYCGELTSFNEGWAEYAAGLGWEMGLYDDPLDGYGRLVHERFTAQRLVVDTGLHLHGWSREKAAAYMKANTTESDAQVASEVLRYGTDLPAQALAYRAGFVELNRLRAKAEQTLGATFDVRAFHEQLLGPGALPFPVIEGHLDRWAKEVRP
ncbi:DUF885 domain-containing protein [Sphaerisporangium sp. NPDC051011]|uniref:DUF885 domain-containing protein n=1 Tax=Sphaerisporangium sp. NPDC051011 TaxID=3155792 RepID=UPI003402C5CE